MALYPRWMSRPATMTATQQGAIFLVNRSLTEAVVADIVWQDGKAVQVDQAWQLAGSDPKEVNSWERRIGCGQSHRGRPSAPIPVATTADAATLAGLRPALTVPPSRKSACNCHMPGRDATRTTPGHYSDGLTVVRP